MTETNIQLGLAFAKTHQQKFNEWVHTPEGGHVANLFIRMAIGLNRSGHKVGAKLIFERIRWHFEVRRAKSSQYKLNNNYHAYLSRLAMERVPELAGYFDTREVGKPCKVVSEKVITVRKYA